MKFLITGITGSLGTEVSSQLLLAGHHVVGYSRDELKQSQFQQSSRLTMYLGDVRDKTRLIEAARDVDVIFHFAALKHVDKLEANPEEANKTNIDGTSNVLHAQRVHGIRRVVLASTDKAAYPINAYGVSKAAAERLTLRNGNNVVCRYGNVLASRGSVIGKFVETLRHDTPYVNITDPNMTRFWITIQDSAQFVISKGLGEAGGLHIPPMNGASVELVSVAVASILKSPSYVTRYIGVRPGEKKHECLRTEFEGEEMHSNTVHQFTHEQLVAMIEPIVKKL